MRHLKRNLTQEIKVAQFAGYVSEHSAYHHGEMSLNKAIVNMAQEFVGSNNINLLLAEWTIWNKTCKVVRIRQVKGISFTQLNTNVRDLYINHDSNVLNYLG